MLMVIDSLRAARPSIERIAAFYVRRVFELADHSKVVSRPRLLFRSRPILPLLPPQCLASLLFTFLDFLL